MQVEGVGENITEHNAAALVGRVDIVFDCAPLFEERYLMNRECVQQGKPMVEAAMFGMEWQVTTIVPGLTPCLRCLYPETPPAWRRRFPVLGAVSAMAGAIAAVEGIKLLTGLGKPLTGVLLYFDAATMEFKHIPVQRRTDCAECGSRGRSPSR